MLFLSGEKAIIPYSLPDSICGGTKPSHGAHWPTAGKTTEGDGLG